MLIWHQYTKVLSTNYIPLQFVPLRSCNNLRWHLLWIISIIAKFGSVESYLLFWAIVVDTWNFKVVWSRSVIKCASKFKNIWLIFSLYKFWFWVANMKFQTWNNSWNRWDLAHSFSKFWKGRMSVKLALTSNFLFNLVCLINDLFICLESHSSGVWHRWLLNQITRIPWCHEIIKTNLKFFTSMTLALFIIFFFFERFITHVF